MTNDKKVLCEKLEELLSKGHGFDVPWNRKHQLYGNPHKVEWLSKNIHIRNSHHKDYVEVMDMITKILN